MNKFLTVLGIGVAVAGLAASSFAQAAGPQGNGGGLGQGGTLGQGAGKGKGQAQGQQGERLMAFAKINKEILAKLDLNKQQQRQVEELQKKSQAAMGALKEKAKASGGREGLREELQKIQKESRDGLLKILTPAQQTQYKELFQAAIEKMRKDGGGARPGTDKKGRKGGGGG